MGAYGGIYFKDGKSIDFEAFKSMSRACKTRACREKEAFLDKSLGIFTGASVFEKRGGLKYFQGAVAAVDGDIVAESLFGGAFGDIDGEFSATVYDGKRLLLVCDKYGKRPVFYTQSGECFAFCSEIKGLLPLFCGGAEVDREVLLSSVLYGEYKTGEEIYKNIYKAPSFGGLIIEKNRISNFSYDAGESTPCEPLTVIMCEKTELLRAEELSVLLTKILYAFDYPSFDCLMPEFIRILSTARGAGGELATYDGSLFMNIEYSIYRRAMLCAAFGRYITCLAPREGRNIKHELAFLEKTLWEIYECTDRVLLRQIFGVDYEKNLIGERSQARSVRTLGLLCQTVTWLQNYNLRVV